MSKIKIGVKKFYYAAQTAEDTASTAATYGSPKAIEGLRTVGIEVDQETNTLYADDGPFATDVGAPTIKVSIELAEIPLEDQAALLGHTYDSTNKTLTSKTSDSPPYVAIMFAGTTSDGGNLGVKLFKGKFSEPNDNYQTKEENIEWQPQTIEGEFVALKNNSTYKYVQEFASGASMDTFFSAVLPS